MTADDRQKEIEKEARLCTVPRSQGSEQRVCLASFRNRNGRISRRFETFSHWTGDAQVEALAQVLGSSNISM